MGKRLNKIQAKQKFRLKRYLGNGLDFRAKLVLNTMKSESILVRDEIDCDTQVSESARATNPVQVRFGHLREIEIDDHIDSLNVNTSSEQICYECKKKKY